MVFVMMAKKPWIVYKTESHFTVEESCCVCRSGVNFHDCRESLSTPTIQGFFVIITKIHYNTLRQQCCNNFICIFKCKLFGIPKCTWRIYDMVQRIAWWWLLREETCSYMHNLTTINKYMCSTETIYFRKFSIYNTSGWLELKQWYLHVPHTITLNRNPPQRFCLCSKCLSINNDYIPKWK
jgi:hypothetical protein